MKFRVDKIDLTELYGWTNNLGEHIWIKVPIGVYEGVVDRVSRLRGNDEKGEPKDPGGKQINCITLAQVLDWNFDDENGKPLPLMSSITGDSEAATTKRLALLAQLPLGLPGFVANKIMNTTPIPTAVEENSKTSSASS